MYYLQKAGMYLHGTFWIGTSKDIGIQQADKHAINDIDDYHDWELCEYIYGEDGGYKDAIYTVNKTKATTKKHLSTVFSE